MGSESYGQKEGEEDFEAVRTVVPSWLSLAESKRLGKRFEMNVLLENIASNFTHTGRPKCGPLVVKDMPLGDWVWKRDQSNVMEHVIFDQEQLDKLDRAVASRYKWQGQEYARLMARWGQIRAFVVGGKLVHTVMSTCDEEENWEYFEVKAPIQLSRVR